MGNIWMPGGGSGADLDVITAGAGDVLAGKVIVDKDGNPMPGTLALSGNASDDQVLAGRSYYSMDPKSKRTGSMPNYSGTPTAIDAIRINNNRFEVAVARGFHGYSWANNGYEYMSYDQVANAIGLTPAKLKKGEWVCGRTGTFEGYVPGVQDLYYRGNNVAGWSGAKVTLDSGQISVNSSADIRTSVNVNLSGKNYLNIEGYAENDGNYYDFYISTNNGSSWTQLYKVVLVKVSGYYTLSISVSPFEMTGLLRLYLDRFNIKGAIYRIWLS